MSSLIRFIRDVSSHEMTVIRDDGLYRHLSFSRPNTRAYSFDIITWPGYLTVTGDMGTWTFSRLRDMFQYFGRRESFQINPGYWAQKFEFGTDCGRYDTPCYEFDGDAFCKGLKEWLASYLEDCTDEDDAQTAKAAIRDLTASSFRRGSDAYNALYYADFPHNVSSYDISEGMGSNMIHSFHYLWICYAIVWGIERYHNKKIAVKAMATCAAFNTIRDSLRAFKGGE